MYLAGLPLSGPLIQEKALELNAKLDNNTNSKASTDYSFIYLFK